MPRDLPPRTKEGALLRRARQRLSPRLSIAAAAKRAGVSAENWGHVERGYQSQGRGQPPRVVIPPGDTLAHMAYAVNITPDELAEIGRKDAADLLGEIIKKRGHTTTVTLERSAPAINSTVPARWLTMELECRGHLADTLIDAVDVLKSVARHWDYSLAELLLESGMAEPADLVIRPKNAVRDAVRDEIEALRRRLEKIVNDPHLSPGQRRDAERAARKALADLERRHGRS